MGSEPHKILHIETEFLVWFVVILELRANTLMAFLWSSHMTDKSQLEKKSCQARKMCMYIEGMNLVLERARTYKDTFLFLSTIIITWARM